MTDPDSRPIRLVLDTSAVAAWARGSVSVGELLAEIDLERGRVAIPLPCLIEAAAHVVSDGEWLDLLAAHSASAVIADKPGEWRVLSTLCNLLGSADLASAAWIALDAGVDVLTAQSHLYSKLSGGSMSIQIED